jgi:hypothetical protein
VKVLAGFVCLLPLSLAGIAEAAAVYRCVGEQGEPRFQQQACAGVGEKVELPPPAARWEALRPAERRLLQTYRGQSSAGQAASPERRPEKPQVSERSCWEKRRRLVRVSARLRRGYKASQGERLRNRRDDLAAFLRRYCD